MMDVMQAKKKLNSIHKTKTRRDVFLGHQERQTTRLNRIAHLLRLYPEEARELIDLILEHEVSAGHVNPKMIRIKKRIGGET